MRDFNARGTVAFAASVLLFLPWAAGDDSPNQPRYQPGNSVPMRESAEVFGPPSLLLSPFLKEELHLTAEQKERIEKLFKVADESRKRSAAEALSHNSGDTEAAAIEARQAMQRIWRQTDKEISKILTPSQYGRYWGIVIQIEGPLAVAWPQVQDRLNMSPAHREHASDVLRQFNLARSNLRQKTHESLSDFYNDPKLKKAEGRDKFVKEYFQNKTPLFDRMYQDEEALRAEAEQEVSRFLSKRQKQTLEKMKGEPFDVSPFRQRNGGYWRPEDAKKYEEKRAAEKEKKTP